jgi:hypothetical protein
LVACFCCFIVAWLLVFVASLLPVCFASLLVRVLFHSLPMAHTCFNQLLLPHYADTRLLKEKLIIAISNSEGFGLM